MTQHTKTPLKVGIAGLGAIGSAVADALINGIDGYVLQGAAELNPPDEIDVTIMDFDALCASCDFIIEALPPHIVPKLYESVAKYKRDMIMVSTSAYLIYPEIKALHDAAGSKVILPSGALCGLDGVTALAQMGIKSATIASTKPPKGLAGAPYIIDNDIDIHAITEKTKIFSGYAMDAAKAFPANVNVAATLSLAGLGGNKTWVEVWADPAASGNSHEIKVIGGFSTITTKIENTPDPNNPKSSKLTAQSIISILRKLSEPLAVM